MKKLILLALICASFTGFAQTYKTVTMALDTPTNQAILRAGTQSLDLNKTYAQIQDGLLSGGAATIGTGSITIATATYRIAKVNYASAQRTFTGIANSPAGTQYYLVVYGKNNSTLDTISGVRANIAVVPNNPINTIKINTILVGSGGVVSSQPDLSGYAKLIGGNNFSGNQFFGFNALSGITNLTSSGTIESNFLGVSSNAVISGTLGVGIQIPQHKLDVNGSVNVIGNYLINGVPINSTGIKVAGDGSFTGVTYPFKGLELFGSDGYRIGFDNKGSTKGLIRYNIINSVFTDTWQHVFSTSNTATPNTFIDLMAIGASGNVGIGNSAPTAKLDVTGDIKATSFIRTGGTASQFLKGDGSVDATSYASTASPTFTGDVQVPAIPVNATSAVSKSFVDNAITGITWKAAARVATTANIVLSGTQTIDAIVLVVGDRVLVKNQTAQVDNGIYLVSATAWTRSLDADSGTEIETATVAVTLGTLNKNTQWTCTATAITIGTTAITFTTISGAGTYAAGAGLSLTGNVFAIDATVATLTGTQTLTNKSISGGQITSAVATATTAATVTTAAQPTITSVGTLTGLTLSGRLILTPATIAISSYRMPTGVAPTTPVTGDWWSLGLRTQTFDGVQTKDVLFDKANSVLAGFGVGAVITDNLGNLSVAPSADRTTSNTQNRSASYTVVLSDFGANGELIIRADATAGNMTITLPSALVMSGLTITVKKIDATANTVTISGSSIDGVTTKVLAGLNVFTSIVSNGTVFSIVGDKATGTGWASYSDGLYTLASPLSIASGVTVTLTNNAATSIKSQLPVGITDFYNSATSKITPGSVGDGYGISIRFRAKSTSPSDFFDFGIDIGGTQGVIFRQTKTFIKGANVEVGFDLSINAFSLTTFIANGGLVKITAGNGTMTVYNIVYDIFRTHKAY